MVHFSVDDTIAIFENLTKVNYSSCFEEPTLKFLKSLNEKYGLKVYLCYRHHNFDKYSVHYLKALDLDLKRIAQKEFEKTHTREEFIETFFKSYL